LTDSEKGELAPWITGAALARDGVVAPVAAAAPAKPRTFVRHWGMADLEARLAGKDRNPANGKRVYQEAQCAVCHRLGGEGGAVGPELTGVGAKYGEADLLRSVLEPSAVISEQFQATLFTTKDGDTVAGRVIEETPDKLVVLVDPLTSARREIAVRDLKSREPSRLSPMPEALVDTFGAEEVLDLIAYLKVAGR
jgi:hypothetical protein